MPYVHEGGKRYFSVRPDLFHPDNPNLFTIHGVTADKRNIPDYRDPPKNPDLPANTYHIPRDTPLLRAQFTPQGIAYSLDQHPDSGLTPEQLSWANLAPRPDPNIKPPPIPVYPLSREHFGSSVKMCTPEEHDASGSSDHTAPSTSNDHIASSSNNHPISTQHEVDLADEFHENLNLGPSLSGRGDWLAFRPRKKKPSLPSGSTAHLSGAEITANLLASAGHDPAGTFRPRTSHVEGGNDRGGRSTTRAGHNVAHARSQSVPLSPELPAHTATGLLGTKGVSEKWDDFFDFDDDADADAATAGMSAVAKGKQPVKPVDKSEAPPPAPVAVPRGILEKQASVHGQFGQVRELTRLVADLRALRAQGARHALLEGRAADLWREAAGIIDLATVDEEPEPLRPGQPSPSASIDFDAFDEDHPSPGCVAPAPAAATAAGAHDASSSPAATAAAPAPAGRPRQESVAQAKHVLETIAKNRAASSPVPGTPPPRPATASAAATPATPTPAPATIALSSDGAAGPATPAGPPASPKKLPFDTTSLRDLVVRAGAVARALADVVRRHEDPAYVPSAAAEGRGPAGGSAAGLSISTMFRVGAARGAEEAAVRRERGSEEGGEEEGDEDEDEEEEGDEDRDFGDAEADLDDQLYETKPEAFAEAEGVSRY